MKKFEKISIVFVKARHILFYKLQVKQRTSGEGWNLCSHGMLLHSNIQKHVSLWHPNDIPTLFTHFPDYSKMEANTAFLLDCIESDERKDFWRHYVVKMNIWNTNLA